MVVRSQLEPLRGEWWWDLSSSRCVAEAIIKNKKFPSPNGGERMVVRSQLEPLRGEWWSDLSSSRCVVNGGEILARAYLFFIYFLCSINVCCVCNAERSHGLGCYSFGWDHTTWSESTDSTCENGWRLSLVSLRNNLKSFVTKPACCLCRLFGTRELGCSRKVAWIWNCLISRTNRFPPDFKEFV